MGRVRWHCIAPLANSSALYHNVLGGGIPLAGNFLALRTQRFVFCARLSFDVMAIAVNVVFWAICAVPDFGCILDPCFIVPHDQWRWTGSCHLWLFLMGHGGWHWWWHCVWHCWWHCVLWLLPVWLLLSCRSVRTEILVKCLDASNQNNRHDRKHNAGPNIGVPQPEGHCQFHRQSYRR